MEDLIIITGVSGTGKTSVLPYLKDSLDSKYVLYDFDDIYKPYDFTDSWEGKVLKKLQELYRENSTKGKVTVVAGLIRPWKLGSLFDLEKTYLIYLDITEQERKIRLIKRNASESLIEDLEELGKFRNWFKDKDYQIIDTSNSNIQEISEKASSIIYKI